MFAKDGVLRVPSRALKTKKDDTERYRPFLFSEQETDGDKAARQPPRKNVASHWIWRRLERNAHAFRLFDCPVDALRSEVSCVPSRAIMRRTGIKPPVAHLVSD